MPRVCQLMKHIEMHTNAKWRAATQRRRAPNRRLTERPPRRPAGGATSTLRPPLLKILQGEGGTASASIDEAHIGVHNCKMARRHAALACPKQAID